LIIAADGSSELWSPRQSCHQRLANFSELAGLRGSMNLIDKQIVLLGANEDQHKKQYRSILNPRKGLLAPEFAVIDMTFLNPSTHTPLPYGNTLTVLADRSHKLENDIWKSIKLEDQHGSDSIILPSNGCQVKIAADEYLLIGGVTQNKNSDTDMVTSDVFRINVTSQTAIKEERSLKLKRTLHSCSAFDSTVIVSGGYSTAEASNNLVADEIYGLGTAESVVLDVSSSLQRSRHTLVRLGDEVFAMGGVSPDISAPPSVERFNMVDKEWEKYSEDLFTTSTTGLMVTEFPMSSVDCSSGCQCGIASNPRKVRIYNGSETEILSIPWIAAIQYDEESRSDNIESSRCSASLIGTNWLVTAAHCLFEENEQIPTRSLAVLLGLHDRRRRTEEFRKRISVSDVFIHENFTSGEPTDDIALIRIDERVNLSLYPPVCLPMDTNNEGGSGHVYGWGQTEDGFTSDVLQETMVDISSSHCPQASDTFADDSFLCVKGTSSGVCEGDSGGPLTLVSEGAHTLVGIVSHGGQAAAACGQSPYDVFMKVSSFLPWIDSTILANGGMASCDYILLAPPKLGTHPSVIS